MGMAHRHRVSSGAMWEPVVGYSPAVRVGPWVSVTGTTAAAPGGGAVGGQDIGAQTRQVLRRIVAALHQVGAGPEHVIRTRIFVTDITRWEDVGRAHGHVFATVRPATSMLEVSRLLDPALLVEIEADALLSSPTSQRTPHPFPAQGGNSSPALRAVVPSAEAGRVLRCDLGQQDGDGTSGDEAPAGLRRRR